MVTEKLLKPTEAAELLGVATTTLAHWRSKGVGPSYSALNARTIRYKLSEILAFVDQRDVGLEDGGSAR